ncbi:Hypothetical predicted protein [Paramuricea clavata]|uniref:Uncharacterized protein n=1 Tax=Paramuricea clavata TaxID=317549 RepID=A0A7D9J1B5_PARCT|nr:Hypothetical predicted protein [Paramuricea clavata]
MAFDFYNVQLTKPRHRLSKGLIARSRRKCGNTLPAANNTLKHVDILQKLVKSYNHSRHRSISMRPVDVNKNNENIVWQTLRERVQKISPGDQSGLVKQSEHLKKDTYPIGLKKCLRNYDLIDSTTLPSTTQCEPNTSELNLSPEDVLVCLRTLDVNKATGPDGISPRLPKETAHQIAPSLSALFNRSLDSGSLPEEWKLANIPVFKKGDKSFVENYRPISLLCVVSKVFERCVLNKLRDHLLQLLNSSQHGFTPGRSCTTQLVEVLNYIGSLLDSGKQTDVIFMDMSKAFDKVSHTALVNKLANYVSA